MPGRGARMNLVAAVVVVAAFAPIRPAHAQEMRFDPAPTEACLAAQAGDPASCIGHAADACMLENPQGETTIGMGFCLSQEWRWWDARLEGVYGALMDLHRQTDAGGTAPSLTDSLTAMQRAWIAYRDAACAYERAQWDGGTGGGPATAACLMRLTGVQALELEGRLGMVERQ